MNLHEGITKLEEVYREKGNIASLARALHTKNGCGRRSGLK